MPTLPERRNRYSSALLWLMLVACGAPRGVSRDVSALEPTSSGGAVPSVVPTASGREQMSEPPCSQGEKVSAARRQNRFVLAERWLREPGPGCRRLPEVQQSLELAEVLGERGAASDALEAARRAQDLGADAQQLGW
jgi:hypothetical protein